MATISDLSCDLVEEILLRVPITSLGAVRCTCKSWNTLFKSRLLCKAQANKQFLGFMMKNSKLCSFRFHRHEEEFAVKEIRNQVEVSEVLICDGLLLCVTVSWDNDIQQQGLMVCNPYLGQTRWIQPRTEYGDSDQYALGYDNNRNHKILRYILGRRGEECEIYDFKSDSWRTLLDVTLDWGCRYDYFHFKASLKGNTYFVYYDGIDEKYTGFLLCFDFTKERFGEQLHLPWSPHDHSYYHTLTPISCFGEEKLAALYIGSPVFGTAIWVTTKIEPSEVLWSNFLKIDLEAIPHVEVVVSFFIDEEKKRAVLFSLDCYDILKTETEREYYNAAYIIGENNFFKTVDLGKMNRHSKFPNVCSNSYVPSLVQIKQNCTERREEEAGSSSAKENQEIELPFFLQ